TQKSNDEKKLDNLNGQRSKACLRASVVPTEYVAYGRRGWRFWSLPYCLRPANERRKQRPLKPAQFERLRSKSAKPADSSHLPAGSKLKTKYLFHSGSGAGSSRTTANWEIGSRPGRSSRVLNRKMK